MGIPIHSECSESHKPLYKIVILGRSTHCGPHCTVGSAIEDPPKRTFWKLIF